MYLFYIDESGDTGTTNSPTRFFVLSAIVVHEHDWQNVLDDLITLRRGFKSSYGLLMKEEIHSYDFISGRPKLNASLNKYQRLAILKECLQWLNARNDISIVTVRCEKKQGADVFDYAWRALIQRLDNTLAFKNFPNGMGNDKGIIFADDTDGGKLTGLLRKMRRHNIVPNRASYGMGSRNITLRAVVEDPVLRNSATSYFHQLADVVAYFARQMYEPNRFIKKKGARNYYQNFLGKVTNPHVTRYSTKNNIVEI